MPTELDPDSIEPDSMPPTQAGEPFHTTHWSLVLSAKNAAGDTSVRALEELCQSYWYPVYSFIRRQARKSDEAKDLTQEFFSRFLARGGFEKADRERGRFRHFLLVSVKNFLTEEHRNATRQKRGGDATHLPFTPDDAESRYALEMEPVDDSSPDRIFDQRWAAAVLERVMKRLSDDYASTGRAEVYQQLQQFLWGRSAELSYAEMGHRLGMSESAVKVAVHRMRQRFRDQLHAEVSATVDSKSEVDGEIRHLLGLFGL
jgi:RNA polymerase sigma-70 factor (ECF subfamily)